MPNGEVIKRAAIVIGVDNIKGLTTLDGAATGAGEFAKWLEKEKFTVFLTTDKKGAKVTAQEIKTKCHEFVNSGSLEQLVIYFSGHGFLYSYSEFWMLPGALDDSNEAIGLVESSYMARRSGIPNVVFISDACRSNNPTVEIGEIKGTQIFPKKAVSRQVATKIDLFYATLPGDPAMETVIDTETKKSEGIFTHCFLQAYKRPYKEMIKEVEVENRKISVVPNNVLENYLIAEVKDLSFKKGNVMGQKPQIDVTSDEKIYIGEYKPLVLDRFTGHKEQAPVITPTASIKDIARAALNEELNKAPNAPATPIQDIINSMERAEVPPAKAGENVLSRVTRVITRSKAGEPASRTAPAATVNTAQQAFKASLGKASIAQTQGVTHFETATGFNISGANVKDAVAVGMDAEILCSRSLSELDLVRLSSHSNPPTVPVAGVAIRFEDGTGTVLAGIKEYIGTIFVDNGRVMNVSYAPSEHTGRWRDYTSERDKLENLRALVATAARYGVFRVDESNAKAVAEKIRYFKMVDPSLGLYAAYAYAEAGDQEEILDILEYMHYDIHARLYDIAMLAGETNEGNSPIVPFCPMLTQGWNLLRSSMMNVPPAIEEASRHLISGLWTTLDKQGIDIIFKAIQEGKLS